MKRPKIRRYREKRREKDELKIKLNQSITIIPLFYFAILLSNTLLLRKGSILLACYLVEVTESAKKKKKS